MGYEIVTLRVSAKKYDNEAIWVHDCDEAFLLMPGDSVLTMLPGYRRVPRGARVLALRHSATYSGVAGAREASRGSRGWFNFQCALLSPLRFVLRHGEALMDGISAEALLTRMARQSLAEALRDNDSGQPARLWAACRSSVERALLDSGWRLSSFRPGRLERGEEASA